MAQAKLMDINTAAQEIDRVLEACWRLRRPVYIRLPTDMVTQKLDATLLDTPLGLEPLSNKVEAESAIVDKILDLLHEAKNPVFLVDANASRFRACISRSIHSFCLLTESRYLMKSTSWFGNQDSLPSSHQWGRAPSTSH